MTVIKRKILVLILISLTLVSCTNNTNIQTALKNKKTVSILDFAGQDYLSEPMKKKLSKLNVNGYEQPDYFLKINIIEKSFNYKYGKEFTTNKDNCIKHSDLEAGTCKKYSKNYELCKYYTYTLSIEFNLVRRIDFTTISSNTITDHTKIKDCEDTIQPVIDNNREFKKLLNKIFKEFFKTMEERKSHE